MTAIFDGKIHEINEKLAYVAKYIRMDLVETINLQDHQWELAQEVAKYILDVNLKLAIELLSQKILQSHVLNREFIYQPDPYDYLNNKATLALLFDRLPDDLKFFETQSLP